MVSRTPGALAVSHFLEADFAVPGREHSRIRFKRGEKEQCLEKPSMTNADIAELFAQEAEQTDGIQQRAFKRAARSAFLWPEHARDLLATGRSLTELKGVGPFIERTLHAWLERPRKTSPPPLRRDFMALADAREILARTPRWRESLRGDLQMHSQWSDGSGRSPTWPPQLRNISTITSP
jgi:hypothetical protein